MTQLEKNVGFFPLTILRKLGRKKEPFQRFSIMESTLRSGMKSGSLSFLYGHQHHLCSSSALTRMYLERTPQS